MGIALYAMFIAIIVPPAVKSLKIAFIVSLSAALSCAFYYIPFIKDNISQGFAIIIVALISAIVAAVLVPVKEKEDE